MTFELRLVSANEDESGNLTLEFNDGVTMTMPRQQWVDEARNDISTYWSAFTRGLVVEDYLRNGNVGVSAFVDTENNNGHWALRYG